MAAMAETAESKKIKLDLQAKKERLEQMRERDARVEFRAKFCSRQSSRANGDASTVSAMEEDGVSGSFSTPENGAGELVVCSGDGGSAKVSDIPVWEVGQRVCVASSSRELLGTVSFTGEQTFAEGRWIGVTLDEPFGDKNGSVDGKVYFTCDEKCGVFLKPESLRVLQLEAAPAMMEVESNVSPIVAELELVKNVGEVNVDGSAVLPAGWRRVPSRSRPGEFSYQNEHTRVRQADVPTEPAISAVKSAENGVSGLDTVGMESMLSIAGLRAESELVENVEAASVSASTLLPEDESEVLLYEPEVDAHLEAAVTGLSHLGEPSVDIPDVCNVEALVGWKKVMSAADKSILAKQDMAEVLAMAMDEMGKLLATMKFARATSIGTHVMACMKEMSSGLPGVSPSVDNPFSVQGSAILVHRDDIDKTDIHIDGKAKVYEKWSASVKVPLAANAFNAVVPPNTSIITGVSGKCDGVPTTTKDAPKTVSRAGVSAPAAITVTITGVSGAREVSTQGQPDGHVWKHGTVAAIYGWEEDGVRRDTIGEISDDHGVKVFFRRQNNAYSDLKEGEHVKFRVQNAENGRQAIHITREEPPAAPSAKKQAPSVVPAVVLAKVKPNSAANQPHKAAPAAKQGQNVKSVPPVQANVCGRLTFANAAAGKIELRTGDEQPRGALTAVVPSDIAAVEARMKTMEESMAAMVKLMQERLPSPDHSPPRPLRI